MQDISRTLAKLLRKFYRIRNHVQRGLNCRIIIEFEQGYELFKEPPYHNINVHADGFMITFEDANLSFKVSDEKLEEALLKLAVQLQTKTYQNLRKEIDRNINWATNQWEKK